MEKETLDCTGGVFNLCINYGGQAEIVDASIKIAELYKDNKRDLNDINGMFYNCKSLTSVKLPKFKEESYISMYELLPEVSKYKRYRIITIFYILGLMITIINKILF